ncbi:MAG: glycosyltransferase [Thermodesulfobacteriota bacterium]
MSMQPRRGDAILVVAPHPDDEVIGCGGYLALARQAGRRVRVIVLTDGALGRASAAVREGECRAGLAVLGVEEVEFWGYPDGSLPLSGPIVQRLQEAVAALRPAEILLPAPTDPHPDHRRATRVLVKALAGQWQGKLLFAEIVTPQAVITRTVDISPVLERKLEAVRCHASQTCQHDYEGGCRALAQLRGVGIGVACAEAFLEYHWEGGEENFFETRPLVSVVVRGDNPAFLACSLASLARQSYDQFEVILVWHGAGEPDLSPYSLLDIRWVAGGVSRAGNLNLGLAEARGDYVAFLDQDDLLYPQHLELLVAELHGRRELDAVYAGCRLTACALEQGQVRVLREEAIFNRPLPPGRLLVGNAIPIHALLYRAQVFRGHRFDETLDVYEDWEFLARVEMAGYRLGHLDAVTCEYRLYDVSEGGGLGELHASKGYLPWRGEVVGRLAARMGGEQLEQLASIVDGLEKREQELASQLACRGQELAGLREAVKRLEELEAALNEGLRALAIEEPGRQGLAMLLGRSLPAETLFSIILPVHDTPAELLSETLFSVARQAYPGWELCLVDDGSSRPETLALLGQVVESPEFAGRLHHKRRQDSGGIVAASNDALALATAPYVLFLDHDDLLHDEALLSLALALRDGRGYGLLYTDSRTVDRTGAPLYVHRKQEWAPETLLHVNAVNHLAVVRRDLLLELGGLRPEFEGGQDWDLLLRLAGCLTDRQVRHIPKPLYDWRATETSVAYRPEAKPWAFPAAKRAVAAHLASLGLDEPEVEANPHGNGVLCRWRSRTPAVEIVVPTHANLSGLQNCLRGLLAETDYPALTLTVVANRAISGIEALLASLAGEQRVRVLQDPGGFNWSRLNNQAARDGDSPLLLFLNDDIEILERGWLRDLVRYLELPGVGVVGATLLFPDGSPQHNGVRTDPQWVAGNIATWGSRNELAVTRNVAAVTGACLLVPRETFQRAGGFDERLAVNYNDIDFCLAVRALGLRVVLANDVRLVHHEMVSRGPLDSPAKQEQWRLESALMREKWGEGLADPYAMGQEVIALATRILSVG